MKHLLRVLGHLSTPSWRAAQLFASPSLESIEREIASSESMHGGEIRFVVESALDLGALLRRQSARERALDVFAQQRVWDTERNNGVLIYLLLADRGFEIVADRGLHALVGDAEWQCICRAMEDAIGSGGHEFAVVTGIRAVTRLLQRHFPRRSDDSNEIPDRPLLL